MRLSRTEIETMKLEAEKQLEYRKKIQTPFFTTCISTLDDLNRHRQHMFIVDNNDTWLFQAMQHENENECVAVVEAIADQSPVNVLRLINEIELLKNDRKRHINTILEHIIDDIEDDMNKPIDEQINLSEACSDLLQKLISKIIQK